MSVLEGPRAGPAMGEAGSLVILLHGYGADGADLIGLAQPLAPHLPRTAFRAPNAPEPCRVNPMGRQWFPISWIDGSAEAEMFAGMERAVGVLDRHITEAMAEEGVGPQETLVVGFSQGTMMALHVVPRREAALAGIVGFSGRLYQAERLPGEALSQPPVLLVHGDMDDVVPVQHLEEARAGLAAAGFEVTTHVSRGTGHGIAPDGLGLALGFMQARLGVAATG